MKRKGMSIASWAFAIVALVAVASVGVVAVQTHMVGQNATVSQTRAQVTNTATTDSQNGLRLSLDVVPSAVSQGGSISISISDFNTLSTANSPTMESLTVAGQALGLGPCNQLPLGVGIFQGYLVASNLTSGSQLKVFEPGVYSCPVEFPVSYYSFSPQSSDVSLYSPQSTGPNGTSSPTLMWTRAAAATLSFSGYWTSQSLLGGTLHPFAPGVYTIVGGDLFGQTAILHFVVSPTGGTVSTTSTESGTTSPSGRSASVNSISGLQLRVALNTTSLIPGQTLGVELSEFNTVNAFNNVSQSDQYPVSVALGECPNTFYQPFGVALYRGNYDAQNFSQGTPLQIFPLVPCPMFVRLITGYGFQPLSDQAVVQPSTGASPVPMAASVNISAVYSGHAQPLEPGTYTLVAADEWGAVAFLYFQVS